MSDSIEKSKTQIQKDKVEIALFAGGCFWCTEAVFQALEGITKVVSGYIGGKTSNPTYKEICTGETGHAEAIQITFHPDVISFSDLLQVFFATHDPTTLNRQGNDIGTQYRSEVFYSNDLQKKITQEYIDLLNTDFTFGKPVVTKISPLAPFYEAEAYHQNYYNSNKTQGYCSFVITPKLDKLKHKFQSKLKRTEA
jgi:peptide-methionine (S)-S-oxide reductase